MKFKAVFKNLILLWTAVLLVFLSVFCVYAEDETVYEPETYAQEETEAPTEAPTEPPTEAPTEPPTEAPTEPPTEVPTEQETKYVAPETDELQETERYTDGTDSAEYYEDNDETLPQKTLPTVAPTQAPKEKAEGDYTYGFASWACVAAGVLVLCAVMISTMGSGRRKKDKKRH